MVCSFRGGDSMWSKHENKEEFEIDFEKSYDGVLDMKLAGLSALLLTLPFAPSAIDRRKGGDRRLGDRRLPR